MAVRIADSLKQQNNLTTFPVAYGADLWLDKNKGVGTPSYDSIQNLYNNGQLGGSSMQVSVMPNASEDYLGNIVQYVGENGTYKKGHFYECIHNITDVSDLYEWQELNHLRFNHTIYSMTTEPINSYFTAGDVIYYTGKSTQNFKANHFYRALPNATPQTIYQVDMKESALVGSVYNCYTPFELRIGFIIFPTSTGGEETPYQITDFDDNGITITPYGWSGSKITYVGASYSTTVLGWEELEGGGGTSIFYGTMDEWNALSADEKKQYEYMADDEEGGSYIDTYSTSEVKTNKVWIDGKPIYRKVFTGLSYGSSSQTWDTTGITISDVAQITNFVGIRAPLQGLVYPMSIRMSGTSVDVYFNDTLTPRATGAIVEYTKTTD